MVKTQRSIGLRTNCLQVKDVALKVRSGISIYDDLSL